MDVKRMEKMNELGKKACVKRYKEKSSVELQNMRINKAQEVGEERGLFTEVVQYCLHVKENCLSCRRWELDM